jgi:hypothetical protein
MAAADTNVRPRRQAPVVTARGARGSGLARLLLPLLELLQLDRKLLLVFAASLMPACIIPVGPNWQDPPGEKNAPPFVRSPMPIGGVRTAAIAPMFSVTPGDVNVRDPLFVRWITEYPDFNGSTIIAFDDPIDPAPDGSETRRPSIFPVSCAQVNRDITTHPITAAISDRPFVQFNSPNDLLAVQTPTDLTIITWFWERACLAQ